MVGSCRNSTEPGALAGVPNLRLAAAKVAPEAEQPLQDALAGAFPNVTMIRVRPILEQAAAAAGPVRETS